MRKVLPVLNYTINQVPLIPHDPGLSGESESLSKGYHKYTFTRSLVQITCFLLSLLVTVLYAQPVYAFTSQEDPDLAQPVYDGISLFEYYSKTLDLVVARQPDDVRNETDAIPFANLPEAISDTSSNFSDYINNIAASLVQHDTDLDALNTFLARSQLTEAADLKAAIQQHIGSAESVLDQMQNAVIDIGNEFHVAAAPAGSTLRMAYDNVIAHIDKIRSIFNLAYQQISSTDVSRPLLPGGTGEPSTPGGTSPGIAQPSTPGGTSPGIAQPLTTPSLTLSVVPLSAYVGDTAAVSGKLNSAGTPLSGRQVLILLDGSPTLTTVTDANGSYQAELTVPYLYVPKMNVMTVYYPTGSDIGVYLAASSLSVSLTVMYYTADLSLRLPDSANPGRAAAVAGTFDFGTGPVPVSRPLEIYLDNILLAKTETGQEFSIDIILDAGLATGSHTLTAAAPAFGRYAPVHTAAILNVIKLVPVLDLQISSVSFTPGELRVAGTLRSTAGPLQNAAVSLTLGKNTVAVTGDSQGVFRAAVPLRYGLELLGSQALTIHVSPAEPWNADLLTSQSVFLINIINCDIFLAILLFSGIFLSRRNPFQKSKFKIQNSLPYSPEPQISEFTAQSPELDVSPSSPDGIIFHLYNSLLQLIQRVTRSLLKPGQTLREFAGTVGPRLGPAAVYFLDLTRLIEKLLYGRAKATDQEVDETRRLTDKIQDGLK